MKQTIASSRRIWSRTTFNIKEATPKNSANTQLEVKRLGWIQPLKWKCHWRDSWRTWTFRCKVRTSKPEQNCSFNFPANSSYTERFF